MREPEPLQQLDRTYVLVHGRKVSYFAGCDYYRLSSHPKVVAAFKTGADRYGINVAASRLTTGNHKLYQTLETSLAEFFGAPAALLVPTGYITNLVAAQALAGSFSHVLIDQRSHGSLQDAALILGCPILEFRHRDAADLKSCVSRCGFGARPILLTDGMFSHDGSVAALDRYFEVLPADSVVLVDDAHAAGVIGSHGRGTLEHCGLQSRARVVQTVTLSKGFGVYGGAVLGSKGLREAALKRSRLFVGSTPMSPPLAAAGLAAISILKTGRGRDRKQLMANTKYVRAQLRAHGLELQENPGPIVALEPAQAQHVARITSILLRRAVFPSFIKYLGGPAAGYCRFVISSQHSRKQLQLLVQSLLELHARNLLGPLL